MNFFKSKCSDTKIACHFTKLIGIVSVFFFIFVVFTSAIRADDRPSEGPGSAEYYHSKVNQNSYGRGANAYHLFEPASPKPDSAPLVVFLHGLMATTPNTYAKWIEHIVKRGNIVVFPIYQSIGSSFDFYTSNSINAVLKAIETLQTEDHVRPDLDAFALVGHSCGGVIAPNIAAKALESGLPFPKAIMAVQPGITPIIPLEDLSKIPGASLLITVVGDIDKMAGDKDAKLIFKRSEQVPLENKDYVTMVSDKHNGSSLSATHFTACCMSLGGSLGTDALDYYCLWKIFDGLTDAAFYGINQEYALGNTPEQCCMGYWDDGTPRKGLIVTDNP